MNKVAEPQERIKCRYCAEMIMPEALICPFCRSNLSSEPSALIQKEPGGTAAPPSMLRLMVLNLLCPGYAAWKLGHRTRGAAIFLVLTVCILIYVAQVVPMIQKQIPMIVKAATSGRPNDLKIITEDVGKEVENNPWMDIAFYIFILSFVDTYFLLVNTRKSDGDQGKK